MTNKLFYRDNLDVLRDQIADEGGDLIHFDPPFNSNAEKDAAFVGIFRDEWDRTYPSLQIITFAGLFQGKRPAIPFVDPSSLKKAKRENGSQGKQGNLL